MTNEELEKLTGMYLRGEVDGISWEVSVTHDSIRLETKNLLTKEQYQNIVRSALYFLRAYLKIAGKVLKTLNKVTVVAGETVQLELGFGNSQRFTYYGEREVSVKGQKFTTNLPKLSVGTAERISKALSVVLAAKKEQEECLQITKKALISSDDAKVLSDTNLTVGAVFVRGGLEKNTRGAYEYTITVGGQCVSLAKLLLERGLQGVKEDLESLKQYTEYLANEEVKRAVVQALEEWFQKIQRVYPVFIRKLSE